MTRNRVKLTLCNKLQPDKKIEIEALEIPDICSALIQVPFQNIRDIMKSKGLTIADDVIDVPEQSRELSILVGADFYWQVTTGKTERISESLTAIETLFGWCLHGPTLMTASCDQTVNFVGVMKVLVEPEISETRALTNQMKAFWELDSLGITSSSANADSESDMVMEKFNASIHYTGDRYEVSLPWKEGVEEISDNYPVAESRLKTLVKKFKFNPTFYEQYREIIQDYLKRGFIEPVNEMTDQERGAKRIFYLPHQAVVRNDKETTRMRVVFDASAHEKDMPSLNDCLHSGPNLLPDLLLILLKFRMYRVAFTADVEKAFLQVALNEQDRDSVRFLWVNDLSESSSPKYQIYRMTRVLFGVTASPFLLSATIKHHIEPFKVTHPDICEIIEENLYMDDLVGGSETAPKACELTSDARNIFAAAGMSLRKWCTNSAVLRDEWEKQLGDNADKWTFSNPHLGDVKVLGLVWRTKNDSLTFEMSALLDMLRSKQNTKRGVLKLAARIYDPVGFLSPYTIVVKCLFQMLWERGLEWDSQLPNDVREKWEGWCEQLPHLQQIEIPRTFFPGSSENEESQLEIHCFCDASEKAYGACVYLRFYVNNVYKIFLLTSKARVAPLNKVSLPRLELMAALVGSRLVNFVKSIWKGEKNISYFYWTDSLIVYHWIHGYTYKWKQFIANRVREIKGVSEPADWGHCPGKENPADLLSRGMEISALKDSQLWWHGPLWLSENKTCWPIQPPGGSEESYAENELKAFLVETHDKPSQSDKQNRLMDLKDHSSLTKIIRITAWTRRFVNNARNRDNVQKGALSVDELHEAELYWVKDAQRTEFSEEIRTLREGGCISAQSKIKSLSPFLDEYGVLRVASRLQSNDLAYTECRPIILPKYAKLVQLLIEFWHKKAMHAGVSHTLSILREKYWIIQGRQSVKKVLKKCIVCRKFAAKPAQASTAPLPSDRTTEAPAFAVVGVDFAGPVYVKESSGQKAYIALFTCAVTRAVHLELVSSLSTPCFILAFRRFIARRGLCHTVYSDNAKTFKRADKELKHLWKAVREKEVKEFFGQSGIKWKNIVECAAWWGGMWERLVRSVKTCLRKTIGSALLTYEELETTLTETEAILNSRPITYVYNEVREPAPLSPACFLTGKKTCTMPQGNPIKENTDSSRKELTRRMAHRSTIITRFWNRWRKDYLLQLRSAHHQVKKKTTEIAVNDVVLIRDDKLPRQLWNMGVVSEVFIGRDGVVRSCAIRLSRGRNIKRPIQLLYPLEIQ